MKNSICRGCAKTYPRNEGVTGKYCSNLCKIKYPKRKNRCKPECRPWNLYLQDVIFKDGQKHTRQVCRLCVFYKYLPKNASEVESKAIGFNKLSEELESNYDKSFYTNPRWLKLRYEIFLKYGRKCMICGTSSGIIQVDHIKPRSKYPQLALDSKNLQVLCKPCNLGKGAWDETDWRPK